MAALIMMLVGLPLMLNGFVQIKERVPPSPEKVTIRDTFYNLRQNKPLFIVLLSFFFCVFHNVAGGLYIYFFINNLGDGSLQMAIGVMGILAAMLCLISPMLTRRMQKRKLFMILCGPRRLGTLGDVGGWISTGDNTVYSTWSKYAFCDDDQHSHLVNDC